MRCGWFEMGCACFCVQQGIGGSNSCEHAYASAGGWLTAGMQRSCQSHTTQQCVTCCLFSTRACMLRHLQHDGAGADRCKCSLCAWSVLWARALTHVSAVYCVDAVYLLINKRSIPMAVEEASMYLAMTSASRLAADVGCQPVGEFSGGGVLGLAWLMTHCRGSTHQMLAVCCCQQGPIL